MNMEEIIKEHGMEIALEDIVTRISEKIDEYKNKRDEKSKNELSILLEDREKIYNNDIGTIKKYIEKIGQKNGK